MKINRHRDSQQQAASLNISLRRCKFIKRNIRGLKFKANVTLYSISQTTMTAAP